MTTAVIITICSLLLIAYLFDLSASRTKIPSVILLLLLGWIVRQITTLLGFELPDLTPLLPLLGTVGLILIVLDGSLELEFKKSKLRMINKSFLGALFSLLLVAFVIAFLFHITGKYPFRESLINAIPFCVISSAIAIPSVKHLCSSSREFVIYESSLSDILGVLFFNFITLNTVIDAGAFGEFGLQLVIMGIISFATTIALSYLMSKVEHNIKFIPIILIVILVYSVSKVFHLPSLIFIMIFGLLLGNLDEFRRFRWIEKFSPGTLEREVKRFREFASEITFLIRALFFLLFGYLINTSDLLNLGSLLWAILIVIVIFGIRAFQLWLFRLPFRPLLFVAPRGLISILLFLTILPKDIIPVVNNSLLIQVIVITAFVMMYGLMSNKPKVEENPAETE